MAQVICHVYICMGWVDGWMDDMHVWMYDMFVYVHIHMNECMLCMSGCMYAMLWIDGWMDGKRSLCMRIGSYLQLKGHVFA